MFFTKAALAAVCLSFSLSASPIIVGPIVFAGQLESGDVLTDNGPFSTPASSPTAFLFFESYYTGAPAVNCRNTGACTGANIQTSNLPWETYQVYLLHLDINPNRLLNPVTLAQDPTFGILFDHPIAGLIVTRAQLNNTDATMGVAGVAYPTPLLQARGLDLLSPDSVTLDATNPALLRAINLSIGSGEDEIRILVENPEPSTWFLLGSALPLLGLARRFRR